MGKFIDLTGMRFGRLTVLNKTNRRGSSGCVYWKCKCDCGNEIETTSTLLKSGQSKSCGCMAKEIQIESGKRNKKFNRYDTSGDYGIGYTTSGDEFYFDLSDYEKIKLICWSIAANGYLVGWLNGKCYSMHRYIIGNDCIGMLVDHKDHNKLNNRRSNLRVCTRSENITNSYSSKGYKGVYWEKNRHKWYSQVYRDNKRIYLGAFTNFEDALKARKAAEEKYYGDFKYDKEQDYRFRDDKNEVSYDQGESYESF